MHLLFITAILYTIYQLCKEKTEKPLPKNSRFDWDKYREDISNGVTATELLNREKKGAYWTTEPEKERPELYDMERYEHDKEKYGVGHAEYLRKLGSYKYKRNF